MKVGPRLQSCRSSVGMQAMGPSCFAWLGTTTSEGEEMAEANEDVLLICVLVFFHQMSFFELQGEEAAIAFISAPRALKNNTQSLP